MNGWENTIDMIGRVVGDYQSGNHLLYPRDDNFKLVWDEVMSIKRLVEAGKGDLLTTDEVSYLYIMSTFFYRGVPDMCETFGMDLRLVQEALNLREDPYRGKFLYHPSGLYLFNIMGSVGNGGSFFCKGISIVEDNVKINPEPGWYHKRGKGFIEFESESGLRRQFALDLNKLLWDFTTATNYF